MNLVKNKITVDSVNTAVTPAELFPSIADDYGSIWLDSSLNCNSKGNYSFIARRPLIDLCWSKRGIKIVNSGKELQINSDINFFEILETFLENQKQFVIGYISYEAAFPFLDIKQKHDTLPFPLARFLIYDSVLVYDHNNLTYSITNPCYDNYDDLFTHAISNERNKSLSDRLTTTLEPVLTKEDYLQKVKHIKHHIKEGDIYQANFTTRFNVKCYRDPFDIYMGLRQLNPSPYSNYINFGDYQILSSSPERMFYKNENYITTSPIKGTIARGNNSLDETKNLKQLLDSDKDKAELLIIVDLERNDLGRIAQTGTVKVDRLFKPEIYSSLIHLVSDISAKLKPKVRMRDIFQAMLPGGSVTGAPKKRAVEIINQLEDYPRSIYTGSIGYIYGDKADFNIAIRTMTHKNGLFYVHAGGGIVADSNPEDEYNEMLLKAKNMFKSLGVNQCAAKA